MAKIFQFQFELILINSKLINIRQKVKWYYGELCTPLYKWRVTWNYAIQPLKKRYQDVFLHSDLFGCHHNFLIFYCIRLQGDIWDWIIWLIKFDVFHKFNKSIEMINDENEYKLNGFERAETPTIKLLFSLV